MKNAKYALTLNLDHKPNLTEVYETTGMLILTLQTLSDQSIQAFHGSCLTDPHKHTEESNTTCSKMTS